MAPLALARVCWSGQSEKTQLYISLHLPGARTTNSDAEVLCISREARIHLVTIDLLNLGPEECVLPHFLGHLVRNIGSQSELISIFGEPITSLVELLTEQRIKHRLSTVLRSTKERSCQRYEYVQSPMDPQSWSVNDSWIDVHECDVGMALGLDLGAIVRRCVWPRGRGRFTLIMTSL